MFYDRKVRKKNFKVNRRKQKKREDRRREKKDNKKKLLFISETIIFSRIFVWKIKTVFFFFCNFTNLKKCFLPGKQRDKNKIAETNKFAQQRVSKTREERRNEKWKGKEERGKALKLLLFIFFLFFIKIQKNWNHKNAFFRNWKEKKKSGQDQLIFFF